MRSPRPRGDRGGIGETLGRYVGARHAQRIPTLAQSPETVQWSRRMNASMLDRSPATSSPCAVSVIGISLPAVGVISVDQAIMIIYGSLLGTCAILYVLSASLTGRSRQG